jgi:hypothetical protein
MGRNPSDWFAEEGCTKCKARLAPAVDPEPKVPCMDREHA